MKNKTAGEVVNEVLMLNSVKKGYSMLIVEGKDDWKFWKSRVHALCEVVDATGKTEGMGAVRRLNGRGFVGHVGVFDRDYPDALAQSNWQGNVIYWDAHSLETICFCSEAFEQALVEHADDARLTGLHAALGVPPRDFVEPIARAVGAVRFVHHLSGSRGDSSRLYPTNYLSAEPLRFDEEAMLTAGVDIGAAPSLQQLRARLNEHANISSRLLMRGHDVTAIVAWIVRYCGGVCGAQRIEQVFRLCFRRADLEQTTVYAELRNWEAARKRSAKSPSEMGGVS